MIGHGNVIFLLTTNDYAVHTVTQQQLLLQRVYFSMLMYVSEFVE